MVIIITQEPIDPRSVYDLLDRKNGGSIVFHFAVVKEQVSGGKSTSGIQYSSQGDTAGELEGIAKMLKEKWELESVVLVRRVGALKVGEIISLVAVSSRNSEDAFSSCREGIALLKKMKTILKAESYQ
ncbi:molybdenum cofactor biosynthesis protein MoaE [Geomesophilobacter sediminis]|uniref:Molybdopterin synthase catalytic subunit n=1 Tax=Geomesophilobacter sediminis TaxID=2798584 RepID=A0A8J7JD90_9BACT|nr:molybdenum cofactor biosynthesis protein MoaE [Geomesophilobacter sediminis]MBJ6725301.1 molybdenum cofactor biosynthesis protein MoaE [Geomesophilobacter sediminis]